MRPFLFDNFAERELVLSTHGLSRRFGNRIALAGLDLAVPEGAANVLTGPNAAGKSTALRSMMQLTSPKPGSIQIFGLDVAEEGARVRTRIGYVPETTQVPYPWMTVERLLGHQAVYFPNWDETYAQRLIHALQVPRDVPYGTLSKGYARRVQLILALAHKPGLLLLDEPTDGLDPLARDLVLGLIVDHLGAVPTTLLFSTHLLSEVEGLADCLGLIRDGHLVVQLDRERLRNLFHSYRLVADKNWQAPLELQDQILSSSNSGREWEFSIWGRPGEVKAQLEATGARVEEPRHPALAQAVHSLLAMEVA